MLKIEILGPGCANCSRLEQLTAKVLEEVGLTADVVKITDPLIYADYGVLTTPGLVVNGETVCSGRVPSLAELKSFVSSAASSGDS